MKAPNFHQLNLVIFGAETIVIWEKSITFTAEKKLINSIITKLHRMKKIFTLLFLLLVIVSNGATGVSEVKQVKVGNGFIYNLDGQRVDDTYKGLVIKNGQKFIRK